MKATNRNRAPLHVVYIAGTGRSGSTVLATILGNHPDAVNVGELEYLPDKGWTHDHFCACGRRARACRFWTSVRERWTAAVPHAGVREYLGLQRSFTRRWSLARHLPPLRGVDGDFRRYAELTRGLLHAVRDVSGVGTVVDSSKNPVRALALSRMAGIDLRIVHLVRDGRGVLWSLKQPYEKDEAAGIERPFRPKPTWRVAGLWVLSNLLSEHACRHVDDACAGRLRYERLVDDPEGAMVDLGRLLGRDLHGLGAMAARGETFEVGHVIAGNRLRMQERIRLQPDRAWREQLGDRDRWLFWLLTAPLMRRYGYRRDA